MRNTVKRDAGKSGGDTSGATVDSVESGEPIESVTVESDGTNTVTATDDSVSGSGDVGNGADFVNPSTAAAGTDNGNPTGKRGRGRPRGSGKGSGKRANTSQTTHDLTGLLVSLHYIAAKSLKIHQLEIDEQEGRQLSAAVTRVTELYDVPIPSEKVMAWVMLAKTLGDVYGPRIAAVALNKKPKIVDAKPHPAPNGATVVDVEAFLKM